MIRFLYLMIVMMNHAFALEAVVRVLEAPLFREKSLDSKVVQYLRKGDVLKIHPSVANDDRYQHLAPSPAKLALLKKKMKDSPEYKDDPLFRGEEANTHSINDEFIPTLDRQGHEVYILSSHIFVYFNDSRELTQIPHTPDLTDYRLQEPLEKKYPLKSPTGFRGQALLGFTQPYSESYPYSANAKTKGYQTPVDFNMNFLKLATTDDQDRLYFGVNFNARFFENRYTLVNGRSANEKAIRLGVGPYITYDAFKGDLNRVNLFGMVNVSPFNQISITQNGESGTDSRTYRAYTITPRVGIQYHRKGIMEDIDFVVGTMVEIEPPATYTATEGAKEDYWVKAGNDQFSTRATFNLGGYFGIQQAY